MFCRCQGRRTSHFYHASAWQGDSSQLTPNRSKKRNLENLAGGDVVLTGDDFAEITEIMKKYPVEGHRYFGSDEAAGLWG